MMGRGSSYPRTGRPADRQTRRLADWRTGRPADWQTGGLADCLAQLLDEVVLHAHLLDLIELRLEPVNVGLLILQDRLHELP